MCHSPELLAAYHGLHRLRVPRHPPHAFLRLTTIDVRQAELRALFQRVTFSCEKVISIKDSLNPTIYHASVVKQHRPSLLRGERGLTIESGWTECVEAKRLRDAFPNRGWLLAIR